jgi:hypothetical protein
VAGWDTSTEKKSVEEICASQIAFDLRLIDFVNVTGRKIFFVAFMQCCKVGAELRVKVFAAHL